jgi:hypothetical protein
VLYAAARRTTQQNQLNYGAVYRFRQREVARRHDAGEKIHQLLLRGVMSAVAEMRIGHYKLD